MIVEPISNVSGAFLITCQTNIDKRGYFCKYFNVDAWKVHGLCTDIVQICEALNDRKYTLRGMHWQVGENSEVKTVRVLEGAIFDVIADVREGSPTYGNIFYKKLYSEGECIYIPAGVAHGYMTMHNHTKLLYTMSKPYDPANQRGFRYDDMFFNIPWPATPEQISERDMSFHFFKNG